MGFTSAFCDTCTKQNQNGHHAVSTRKYQTDTNTYGFWWAKESGKDVPTNLAVFCCGGVHLGLHLPAVLTDHVHSHHWICNLMLADVATLEHVQKESVTMAKGPPRSRGGGEHI